MHRLDQVIKGAVARVIDSVNIHGDWRTYTPEEIRDVVFEEFREYLEAVKAGEVHGEHGQIDELMDLICVAAKGIIQLLRLYPVYGDPAPGTGDQKKTGLQSDDGPAIQVVIQGNVIGKDRWVEEVLAPTMKAMVSRNIDPLGQ